MSEIVGSETDFDNFLPPPNFWTKMVIFFGKYFNKPVKRKRLFRLTTKLKMYTRLLIFQYVILSVIFRFIMGKKLKRNVFKKLSFLWQALYFLKL